MPRNRINDLIAEAMGLISKRTTEDGKCVFCGEEIENGRYCSCLKSFNNNQKVKLFNFLTDQYNFLTCTVKEYTNNQLVAANFPKKFLSMQFENFIAATPEQTNNLKLTKEYAENGLKHYLNGTNLIFVGNFGNGKTMLMSLAGKYIIERFGIQVQYLNIYDFSEEIKKTFDSKELSTSKYIDSIRKSPILVLDDIDKKTPSSYMCDLMYGIANYRSEKQLPTWINANHSLEELSDKFYGEGTMSRFFENSIKAKFTGENWRLKNA